MTALTIAVANEAGLPGFGTTLASLPLSFTKATRTPDVVVISGDDWVEEANAAVLTGVRGVIVFGDLIADSKAVRALHQKATASGVHVEFAEQYAGDPGLARHRAELAAHLQALSVLVVSQTAEAINPRSAALTMHRSLRALGVEPTWDAPRSTSRNVVLHGTAGALLIEGAVTQTSTPALQRIEGLGFSRTLNIHLFGSYNARPADLVVCTMAGEKRLSAVYETAERSALIRVRDALRSAQPTADVLLVLAEDLDSLL